MSGPNQYLWLFSENVSLLGQTLLAFILADDDEVRGLHLGGSRSPGAPGWHRGGQVDRGEGQRRPGTRGDFQVRNLAHAGVFTTDDCISRRVDQYGFFIYWKSEGREGDVKELSQVNDIRGGELPKVCKN